ncbi:MAG: type II toxin-antitoxin system YoeB family toxin [Methylococcaceae bacterium]
MNHLLVKSGFWSRRIDSEQRLVDAYEDDAVLTL